MDKTKKTFEPDKIYLNDPHEYFSGDCNENTVTWSEDRINVEDHEYVKIEKYEDLKCCGNCALYCDKCELASLGYECCEFWTYDFRYKKNRLAMGDNLKNEIKEKINENSFMDFPVDMDDEMSDL